ncbi:MAG: hypothetical protein KBA81_04175 [Rhabdochlamydiaceae bacterium]|nr:hypothetical protein [Rhabdochlamydiaceae bacterium]
MKLCPPEEYKARSEAQAKKLKGLAMTLEDKVLQEFNKKYAIVRTSTTYILVQKNRTSFELDSRSSFKNFHENDFFESSKGETKNKAIFWLKHPDRRTFENIVFDPTRPGDYEGNFNIFKGFAFESQQGDCSLYWRHVEEVICNGNVEHYQYVRKWMACVIQKPTLLATAIVLRGLQGTGKNKFAEYFGKLFGPYFLTVTCLEHITGKFNNHLKYAYLVHANEALYGGNSKEIGALKAFITDPTIIIEGKGRDAIPVDNCRHLIVSSNEDWAVPMDLDDRRFFVLNVSSHRKEDIDYFHKLHEQMDSAGLSALLFDLLNEDLSNFDPRKMPPNDFGFDMKMKAASSVEKYIFESLKEGKFNLTTSAPGQWCPHSCENIYDYYKVWCENEDLRTVPSSEFGKRLKKLLSVEKTRRSIGGLRERWYEFPSLEESRKTFEKFTKQSEHIWEE